MAARRIALAALALAVATAAVRVPGGTMTAADEPVTNLSRQWVKVNADTVTEAQAVAIARRFEVVVSSPKTLAPHLPAMRAANPAVRVVVYRNGTYSRPEQTYADNLYAVDAAGNRITANSDNGVLMNPAKAAWRFAVASDCLSRRKEGGYDGCYVDVLGLAPLGPNYGSSIPVKPRTGKVWTETQWLTATAGIGAAVKDLDPAALIVVNGLQNGKRYAGMATPGVWTEQGASSVLLAGVDGGNAEDFIRTAELPADEARKEWMWKADVDMLVDAGNRGKSVFAMTKVWVPATPEQIDTIHEYALASFLLGTDGSSFFTFFSDLDRMNIDEVTRPGRWDALDIGAPVGHYVKWGAVYARDFLGGLAVVNPTAGTTTVPLASGLVDIDGAVVTSLVLPPHTGRILRSPLF